MQALTQRSFDFIVSLLGLLSCSPILVLIAVLIKLSSRGPVLFRQTRVGLHGKDFSLFKYRTMIVGAESLGRETLGTNDPRITKIGAFLRKTKMDELPQLLNVLLGDMSIVGPRPEIPYYAKKYDKDDQIVLSIRPGITDPSSLQLIHLDTMMEQRGSQSAEDFYTNVIMPKKLKLQKEYIKKKTFFGDIKLMFLTVLRIFGCKRV